MHAKRSVSKSHMDIKQTLDTTLLHADKRVVNNIPLNKIKFLREQVKEIEKEEAQKKEEKRQRHHKKLQDEVAYNKSVKENLLADKQ